MSAGTISNSTSSAGPEYELCQNDMNSLISLIKLLKFEYIIRYSEVNHGIGY